MQSLWFIRAFIDGERMADLPHPGQTLGHPPSPSNFDSHLNVVKGWQIRQYLTNVSGNPVNENKIQESPAYKLVYGEMQYSLTLDMKYKRLR